jgi:polysaccharide pyruvyl transferase WcaK-like protein
MERIPPDTEIYAPGVGLGYESESELLRGRRLPLALFRNREDVEIAKTAGINAVYCPALTFALPAAEHPQKPCDHAPKRLGITLSDEISPTWENVSPREYACFEYFKWEFAAILDELARHYLIEFIPLSVLDSIDDRTVHQDVYRRMRMRSSAILHNEELSVQQARDLIASFDLIVTMKYHGVLFSVQAGIPFINIAVSRKSRLFCHENGLDRLTIPEYSLQRDRFLDVVRFAERPGCRSDVQRAALELRAEASQTFPKALDLYVKQALGQ